MEKSGLLACKNVGSAYTFFLLGLIAPLIPQEKPVLKPGWGAETEAGKSWTNGSTHPFYAVCVQASVWAVEPLIDGIFERIRKMRTALATILTVGLVLALAAVATAAPVPVTTGLRAQYDASAITGVNDGDRVYSWADLAGGDDNASTGGYGAYTGIHWIANAQNGLGAMRCDVYAGDIGDWFNIPSITPTYIFFVGKETRASRSSTMMGQSSNIDYHNGGSAGVFANYGTVNEHWVGKLDGTGINLVTQKYSLNTPFILSIDETAPTWARYTNRIGSDRDGYGSRAWGGDIYEVLLYTGALTADEQNAIGYYLQEKWGIAGAYTNPIPEPATMSLLVIGGIAALIRRNRR
ncbi:MAG: PEP-CTERM sorting domain-containing protein [Planctomycetaceae bacterium]|nr:PEP-CTERM sorting domain-containing protein [Planctomycetaceae bacterium]